MYLYCPRMKAVESWGYIFHKYMIKTYQKHLQIFKNQEAPNQTIHTGTSRAEMNSPANQRAA